ncbi:hypothetical protein T02_4797 [Trichinella nativa]|uniref:Uncharacterized protein n=1 Tax=Trichinella nativa TaxID=6335 RepID=A0A0V1LLR1_9BILA|nr:hypothetical protein T02_4797 [Trichinella nativa]
MEPCNDSVIHKPNVKINAQKWVFCAVPLTVLRFLIVGQTPEKGERATTWLAANCSLTIMSVAISIQ